jgi:hypothetical protein
VPILEPSPHNRLIAAGLRRAQASKRRSRRDSINPQVNDIDPQLATFIRSQMTDDRYSGFKSSCSTRHALCPMPYAPCPFCPQRATKYQKTGNRSQKSDVRCSGFTSPHSCFRFPHSDFPLPNSHLFSIPHSPFRLPNSPILSSAR